MKMEDIICDKCGKKLEEAGALIFSPMEDLWNERYTTHRSITEKFHICISCWDRLRRWMNEM